MEVLAFVCGVVVGWLLGGAFHTLSSGHVHLIEHFLKRWWVKQRFWRR